MLYMNMVKKNFQDKLPEIYVNIEKIKKQAISVYKLGMNENTRKKYNICDFKKLEEKCLEYLSLKNTEK